MRWPIVICTSPGVVAVVAAGLVFGTIGRMRVGTKEWESVSVIWSQLGFWASSLVFVLASMLVPETIRQARPSDLLLLVALLVGALSARALCLWGVLPIVRMLLAPAADQLALQARHPLGRRAWRRDAGPGLGRGGVNDIACRPRSATSSRCWPPASSCSPCWCRPPLCDR